MHPMQEALMLVRENRISAKPLVTLSTCGLDWDEILTIVRQSVSKAAPGAYLRTVARNKRVEWQATNKILPRNVPKRVKQLVMEQGYPIQVLPKRRFKVGTEVFDSRWRKVAEG